MADDTQRLIPDFRVSVGGSKLELDDDARLTRVIVELDADLFGHCSLMFNDPNLALINGKKFDSGTAVKVEVGFGARLSQVFEGEVVALEPAFRRDQPPALKVICFEPLHRLGLTPMTRAFNDVDGKDVATQIAQEHGLSVDAPSGTKEHMLQANVTDAVFLKRLAQQQGNTVRVEGKKLIIGPPPKGEDVAVAPGAGLKRMKVTTSAKQQVTEVTAHGWDPKSKQEITAKASPQGDTGEGAQKYGKGSVAVVGNDPLPPDISTAEAVAKGRLRKIAEGFVVAEGKMIGDARVIPGATLQMDKLGNGVDGGFRVDYARHEVSKHGYFVDFKATRVAKKTPAAKSAESAAAQQQKQEQQKAGEQAVQDSMAPPPASNQDAQAQAQVMKDAAQDGAPFCEECEKAKADIEKQKQEQLAA